jgi:hypothetical protein
MNPLSHGETLKILVESYDPLRFLASFKSKWCGWDLTPAWFPISSKRIGGEPANTELRGVYKTPLFLYNG